MMPRAANNYPNEKEVDDDLRSDPHIVTLSLPGQSLPLEEDLRSTRENSKGQRREANQIVARHLGFGH